MPHWTGPGIWAVASETAGDLDAGLNRRVPDPGPRASRTPLMPTGESVEDQDAAGPLSRAQRLECVVQLFQPDAAGDELVEQQIPRQILTGQRRHIALQVGRPEIAAPDDLLVDEEPGAERHRSPMRHKSDDDGLAAHIERRPRLLDRLFPARSLEGVVDPAHKLADCPGRVLLP